MKNIHSDTSGDRREWGQRSLFSVRRTAAETLVNRSRENVSPDVSEVSTTGAGGIGRRAVNYRRRAHLSGQHIQLSG